jgi:hypothetical protein
MSDSALFFVRFSFDGLTQLLHIAPEGGEGLAALEQAAQDANENDEARLFVEGCLRQVKPGANAHVAHVPVHARSSEARVRPPLSEPRKLPS